MSNVDQFDEFVECAKLIKDKRHIDSVTFPVVLYYLKNKTKGFNFKAIRVWPHPETYKETIVKFPGNKLFLALVDKIQICFFDKTLLVHPYEIVYKKISVAEQTI